MNRIFPPSRQRASAPYSRDRDPAADTGRTVPDTPVKTTLMRRYDVRYLDHDNVPAAHSAIAPATDLFESAFSAFARGTLIRTDQGPCAVEDLEPGMRIETEEFGLLPMLWRGMMNIIPNTPTDRPERAQLTRVMAGTFGASRPVSDLVLGPAALMPHRGGADGFTPVSRFADGDCVIQTSPPSPVQVFHICLPQQATVCANGLPILSYHPRHAVSDITGPQMQRLFLSLFPHLGAIGDFGPALRRTPEPYVKMLENVAI